MARKILSNLICALLIVSFINIISCGSSGQEIRTCNIKDDCLFGEWCLDGKCGQVECKKNGDCSGDTVCLDEKCQKKNLGCGSVEKKECKDISTLQECQSDGNWKEVRCASDEECKNNICAKKRPIECSPTGQKKCKDSNSVFECQGDGNWKEIRCASDEECKNGECLKLAVCVPGEKKCDGNATFICKTDGLGWDKTNCSSEQECINGECKAKGCSPFGKKECKDSAIFQECQVDGTWKETRCASDEECKNGECLKLAVCVPGGKKCDGNSALVCKTDGLGWDKTNCSSEQECINGECKIKSCGASGKKECKDTAILRECQSDGSWKETRCASDEECKTDVCVKICNNLCSENELRCISTGNGYQICQKQINGCNDWGSIAYCNTNEICSLGKCIMQYPNCKIDSDCHSGEYCDLNPMTCKNFPATVTILLVGALINIGDATGAQWDGVGSVDSNAFKGILALLTTTTGGAAAAAAAVASELTKYANSGWGPPDPFGTISIVAGLPSGVTASQPIPTATDTYTPLWPTLGWQNVPFNTNLKVSVTLMDEDFSNHDFIGTAQFGYADILQALKSGKVHQIQVNQQTNNQLLFLSITVTP